VHPTISVDDDELNYQTRSSNAFGENDFERRAITGKTAIPRFSPVV